MVRPSWDAGELARSALAEMPEVERVELLTELLCRCGDLGALIHARNAITDRAAEIIADRYTDTLLGEGAA